MKGHVSFWQVFRGAIGGLEFFLSILLYVIRIKFLRITAVGRIGHLAVEPDTFIKLRALKLRPWYIGVLICPESSGANRCLVDYWSRYLFVIRSPHVAKIAQRLSRFDHLQFNISRYWVAINETAPGVAVQSAWGTRPPLLSINENQLASGRAWLQTLGVPMGAPYVCFHSREEGFSPDDDPLHSFRNSSISNYIESVRYLTARGFWCIRMGDPSMSPLPKMDHVIDYAMSKHRSEALDVFLCASCSFFLGSASGLLLLAGVFGRPCAAANQVPLSTVLVFGSKDIAIPKLLWSEAESRYLTFREVFDSDIANFRFTELYQQHGIRVVENAPEDVLDLALEMLDRIEARFAYSPKDEALQLRFKSLMREGHYSFGGSTRVGRNFLRKYEHLLGDKPKI